MRKPTKDEQLQLAFERYLKTHGHPLNVQRAIDSWRQHPQAVEPEPVAPAAPEDSDDPPAAPAIGKDDRDSSEREATPEAP